jgi:hypothetical protein
MLSKLQQIDEVEDERSDSEQFSGKEKGNNHKKYSF